MIGNERLMQAREFYSPSRATLAADAAFARWTKRIAVQSELATARELAGLSDAQLDALESEFIRRPTRPRSAWARVGVWVGALVIALAFAGFFMADMPEVDAAASKALTAFGLGLLLVGAVCMGVSGLAAFGGAHLDLNYGATGLYVGRLDEQHPWLYKTKRLLRYEAVESYRQAVLRERGPLRGLDCVMMEALVAAHDALERVCPASTVAEQLQSHGRPIEPLSAEPRLVQVGSAANGAPARARERGDVKGEAA